MKSPTDADWKTEVDEAAVQCAETVGEANWAVMLKQRNSKTKVNSPMRQFALS